MLNFRKLRQDFSSNILKEGKELYEKKLVVDAKILHLDNSSLRLSSRVRGVYENVYECEIEIDRTESIAVDSNCDCTYTYDCQHIAASLFHLEEHLNKIIVDFSKKADFEKSSAIDDSAKEKLKETFTVAETQEAAKKEITLQKELLSDYINASKVLGSSPFFYPEEKIGEEKAELAVIFSLSGLVEKKGVEVQLGLRLPFRSKPLHLSNVKAFIDGIRYREPLIIGGRKCFFTPHSFGPIDSEILQLLMSHAHFYGGGEEKYLRAFSIDPEAFGIILAKVYEMVSAPSTVATRGTHILPSLYIETLEEPFFFSNSPAAIQFEIEYFESPIPNLLLKPSLVVEEGAVSLEEGLLFDSAKPGFLYKNTYYRFPVAIKRVHLRSLAELREVAIPEPLFGTFIENALPILRSYAMVTNPSFVDRFITLPYVKEMSARCLVHYLEGELEATLFFIYDQVEIPCAPGELKVRHLTHFVSKEGILARNLVEEKKLIEDLFQDFLYDEKDGVYRSKSEKKIVEFMTEVIPRNQHRVHFECPENLLDQFIYDNTRFELNLRESSSIDSFEIGLKVEGYLQGTTVDRLWECIAAKKRYLELSAPTQAQPSKGKRGKSQGKMPRILILDLEKLTPLIQVFDEMGIQTLSDQVAKRPLWGVAPIEPKYFDNLPVTFSMSERLKTIQMQIRGEQSFAPSALPEEIQATLRKYQLEGVHWLERLRQMHLGGVLADDMGLGKTLQTIVAITQQKQAKGKSSSLIVSPTSLVYNWQEEFHKFNPALKVIVVDNIPAVRKKLLKSATDYDVVITSYNLLQKDIDTYSALDFSYVVLDEAQHIKNRETRNAKSVKLLKGKHKLILTGTPIENSLDELWSLFDFLMPGLLGSYDRFVEKYIRMSVHGSSEGALEGLKKKVSPFILRRMKADVLADLPPVSEVVYHCHLNETQKALYQSYAASAKEELSRLVERQGFEKIQIHVLATLTRLKQICCHPAIFAKESVEEGDSAKYDMLMELLRSLIESKHKTVIFSQYTKMLQIMRHDLESMGISFAYLDGSSKNRLKIVKDFNENPDIPVFLISLKAGGAGLNLVGADTVIHYDMWWNPAVEDQATDRLHRIGQTKKVHSYKLITLGTIEEKISVLQNRKRGLVKKIISTDEEAIAKLTWEEVLELLQI